MAEYYRHMFGIPYELAGDSHFYDVMPDETYKSASADLLIKYGDNKRSF